MPKNLIKERNDQETHIPLWREVKEGLFKEIKETFYLATPWLKAARMDANLSIREIAERMGVSPSFYCEFEMGKRRSSPEYVKKIQDVLNGKSNNI